MVDSVDQEVLDVDDFAGADEVRVLREAFYRALAAGEAGAASLSTRAMAGDAELTAAAEIARTVGAPAGDAIAAARSRIIALTAKSFAAHDIMPNWSAFTEMRVGAYIDLHADAERETPDGWEPNHSPWLSHVALLYLGSAGVDFRGGELVLPDIDRTISPVAGQLVAFPSGRKHRHRVTSVESGARLTLVVWFTRDTAHREQGWPSD